MSNSGRSFMMALYVALKGMYTEHLRVLCPLMEDMAEGSNVYLHGGSLFSSGRRDGGKGDGLAMLRSE